MGEGSGRLDARRSKREVALFRRLAPGRHGPAEDGAEARLREGDGPRVREGALVPPAPELLHRPGYFSGGVTLSRLTVLSSAPNFTL